MVLKKSAKQFASKICIDKVILGGEKSELLNHIVSIGVNMIYSKRQLSVALFLAILKTDFNTERYSAKVKNEMEEFREKWKLIINLLPDSES